MDFNMEKPKLTRTNKPQRPPLMKYIRGEAKLEDLVCKNKIIAPDPSRTNRRAVLASINSVSRNMSSSNKSQVRKTDQTSSSAKHGHSDFSSGSSSVKSRCKTETKNDPMSSARLKVAISSSSLGESERSAQGDMTESTVRTLSASTCVLVDRVLNAKERKIHTLTEEIEKLKQISKVRSEQETVSLLQKLLDDLPSDDHQNLSESPDNVDILVERLRNAIRTLRESGEKFSQINAEKEEKLNEVSVENGLLQKRIESLQSDLQKVTEANEVYTNQLTNFQVQNERLRANLKSTRRVHKSGIEICGALQLFIQDKLPNETNELQNFEKMLRERINQLEREFEKLETACRRHISCLEKTPRQQIENLNAKLHETEIERMRQVCEVTAYYREQEKQNNKFCETLKIENRKLQNCNQYLQQKNEALEEVCQKKIEFLTSPLKQQTLVKLNRKSLDAERAYSHELLKLTDETMRVTRGSNDH